jgi:hypothetical protein
MIGNALGFLIRIALLTAATGSGVAIVVARTHPEEAPRRTEAAAPFQVLNANLTGGWTGAGPRLLDVASGRLEALALPPGSALDKASLSPWEDRGRRQVVGVAWNRSGMDRSLVYSNVGMVRMTLPGYEILDKVDLTGSALPSGSPCWLPGTRARVLYAGGDGQIYRLDFESGDEVADPPEIRPRVVRWGTPIPADGQVDVIDLCRPDDPRLGGRFLASLYFKRGGADGRNAWQVWWLELDPGATSILAAGPILRPEPGDEVGEYRLPNLVRRHAGATATLAYLARVAEQPGYELRIVPVRFDSGSDVPHAAEAETRVLARGCVLATPTASPDGRWLTVLRPEGRSVRPERLALSEDSTLVTRLP